MNYFGKGFNNETISTRELEETVLKIKDVPNVLYTLGNLC